MVLLFRLLTKPFVFLSNVFFSKRKTHYFGFGLSLVLFTMPQVFQVLRCYKCNIFQVHQTKKDNKWICKICNEKQSIKRHYGIGTAKDCRTHVQKLNNLQGDKEASFKTIGSEDSDSEEYLSPDKSNINKTELVTDNSTKQSKWSAYIEKEEIPEVNEPEYIDNIEVSVESRQKRKLNIKCKSTKVLKVSGSTTDTNIENTAGSNHLISSEQCVNATNLFFNSNLSKEFDKIVEEDQSLDLNKNKRLNTATFPVNKSSKWAQFMNTDDTDDQHKLVENKGGNRDYKHHHETGDEEYTELEQEEDDIEHKNVPEDIDQSNNIKEKEYISRNCLFSLCDDNDLDNILDF